MNIYIWEIAKYCLDTGSTLKVHKTFGRRLRRLPNVSCTLNLRSVSRGKEYYEYRKFKLSMIVAKFLKNTGHEVHFR